MGKEKKLPFEMRAIRRNRSDEGSWHDHFQGQLFVIKQGLMILDTERARQIMPVDRVGWIPPMHKHKGTTFGPIYAQSIYLDPSFSRLLPKAPCVFYLSPLLREILNKIENWKTGENLKASQLRLLGILKDEIKEFKSAPLHLPMPKDKKLEKATQLFMKNPAIEKTLEEWAADIHMSKRTFTRHFKQQTGTSFAKWCQQARIMQALELLSKGHSVTAVSLNLGYDSVSAFIKVFIKYLGCTPSIYKKTAKIALQ